MTDDRSEPRTQAKSAARALDILQELAAHPTGMTFSELCEALELPKSSAHELLGVLVGRGVVTLDSETRRYRLGIRVWELAQAYIGDRDLLLQARPAMDGIVALLDETVQLAVLDGLENVYLAKVDCSHALRLNSDVGRRLPAHATGLGKVLLAHLPPDELAFRLSGHNLTSFTPHTITDLGRLRNELRQIVARGFGTDEEEYTYGVRCVAVPIRDGRAVVAAMSCSIPSVRATPSQLASALRLLAQASLSVSRRLGTKQDDPVLTSLSARPADELTSLFRSPSLVEVQTR